MPASYSVTVKFTVPVNSTISLALGGGTGQPPGVVKAVASATPGVAGSNDLGTIVLDATAAIDFSTGSTIQAMRQNLAIANVFAALYAAHFAGKCGDITLA